jgi:hypothetical protein
MALASHKAKAAREDFRRAIRTADKYRVPFRAGRARLELARLHGKRGARIELLEQAERDLAANRPWLWRTRLLKGSLCGESPQEALEQFIAMGMDRDAKDAQSLCDKAST